MSGHVVSLFGEIGEKVVGVNLRPGAEVLFYAAEEIKFFGVVTVETRPRHFGVKVFAGVGVHESMVGTSVHIRLARNSGEMTVGKDTAGSLLPVAAWQPIHDVACLDFVEEQQLEELHKILEVSRQLFGDGGELGPNPPEQYVDDGELGTGGGASGIVPGRTKAKVDTDPCNKSISKLKLINFGHRKNW